MPRDQETPGRSARRAGFTILELLTVIAVIAILATILIPVVGNVQRNAKKAKTRVQFSQWGAAIEAFRQEYGFYPNFGSALIDDATKTRQFVETLSGRTLTGGALANTDPGHVAGNTKRIRFYAFATDDLDDAAPPRLVDAFGNPEIAMLMDRDYNGIIKAEGSGGDGYAAYPTVGSSWAPPIPADGIRAGVIFYSRGANTSPDDIVTSW